VAATVDHARRLLDQGTPWSGLGGDSLAYVLATVATTGRWLVAVDGEDRAERVARALRFFHADPDRVLSFPADDQRPYDGFSPAPAVVHARLRALERVDRGGDVIVVASARALSQRVPDRATRARGTLTLEVGQRIDRDEVVRQLTDAGYLHTARADEVGHVAARGDLVDVWPAAKAAPVRLEWFDDELERIVRLDPSTLTPDKAGKKVTVLPAAEERLDAAARQRALVELARLMQRQGDGSANMRRRAFVDALEAGARTSALQDWLPVLVPTVAPLEALAGLRLVVVAPRRRRRDGPRLRPRLPAAVRGPRPRGSAARAARRSVRPRRAGAGRARRWPRRPRPRHRPHRRPAVSGAPTSWRSAAPSSRRWSSASSSGPTTTPASRWWSKTRPGATGCSRCSSHTGCAQSWPAARCSSPAAR
jgi:hypothetical protein